jgi:hypothetical protein
MPSADNKIHFELSHDEALVFFEWLSRFNKAGPAKFEDQAEQRVLWDLEGQLESILVEPFESNYGDLLAKARAQVRDAKE